MNRTTTIGEVMTAHPLSVGPQNKISDAKRLMMKHSIKHLPVVEESRVIGILTDRDIKLRQAVSNDTDFHETALVESVYLPNPYTTMPNAPLTEALGAMTEESIGSAIVVDDTGKLLGIFTNMDACRLLLDVLENRPGPQQGPASR